MNDSTIRAAVFDALDEYEKNGLGRAMFNVEESLADSARLQFVDRVVERIRAQETKPKGRIERPFPFQIVSR